MSVIRRVTAALAGAAMLVSNIQPALAADRPVSTAASPESVGFSSQRLGKLKAGMKGVVDRGEATGLVTLLARHGKVVAFDTHGKQSAATGAPMSRDSIFRIYSMTKPVTGVAMMILYEEGRWRLDDPVTKHVPEFAKLQVFKSLDADGKPVLEPMKRPPTMRELMTHTAGFGYGLSGTDYVNDAFRTRGVLSSKGLKPMIDVVAGIPLQGQPGERWSYSIAVDVQGYIVEKLSGQKLGDFMQQRMFGPLKMKDTGFFAPPAKAARLADLYRWDAKTGALGATPAVGGADFKQPPQLESGGGGLVSTASDYARFAQMLLNGGVLEGARILSPASVALMSSNHLPERLLVSTDGTSTGAFNQATGFGLDFAVTTDPIRAGTMDGKGTYYWGGLAGTWFWIDPTNDVVFVGMVQRYGDAPGGADLRSLSRALVYQALTDPAK